MAPEDDTGEPEKRTVGLISLVKSLLLKPFNVILSKTALRAYLTTFLAVATGIVLLGFAITAYALFYWNYVPRIGFERSVHLQFDNVYGPSYSRSGSSTGTSRYPFGTVSLWPDIVGVQQYDVVVELTFPRTPGNVEAGNFMLEVSMYAPEEKGKSIMQTVQAGVAPGTQEPAVLANSRRPAILPYRSPLVDLAWKFSELHWYLLGFRQEADKLRISMFESVEFPKGWRNVPSTLKLELQSTRQMQIYSAKAIFRARFRGLRWLMYNHRITSAVIFVGGFWTTEMVFAGLAWAALAVFFATPPQEVEAESVHEVAQRIKAEPEDDGKAAQLSDTERTFPTLSGQQPLHYESETRIKQEDEDDMAVVVPEHVARAADADVEDAEEEDADFFPDSGLGTSMESSSANRRESMRRRRGRAGSRQND